jgi:hypothetical protein
MPINRSVSKEKKPRIPPLKIQDAQIVYRNFAGKAKTYNAKGLRNFHVVLDKDQAKMLERDGWNVKWPKPREDGEERNPTLKVNVRFDNYPPFILMLTEKGKLELDEESVEVLDFAEIKIVKEIKVVGSYYKTDDGKEGFKTYLSEMVVILSENDIRSKYHNVSSAKDIDPEDDD